MKKHILILLLINLLSCSDANDSMITEENEPVITTPTDPTQQPIGEMYFPPKTENTWETTSPESLEWNTSEIENLKTFLCENNTHAFIILKNGKIVIEEYWDLNILNTIDFTEDTIWYWASTGKTLTAFLTGIAQQEGLLNINDKTSDYLGEGWTSLSEEKRSSYYCEESVNYDYSFRL